MERDLEDYISKGQWLQAHMYLVGAARSALTIAASRPQEAEQQRDEFLALSDRLREARRGAAA